MPSQLTEESTLMFLMIYLILNSSAFAIYWGDPWKVKFYDHVPMFFLFIINYVLSILFFFFTKQIKDTFTLCELELEITGPCLGIGFATIFIQILYNCKIHQL